MDNQAGIAEQIQREQEKRFIQRYMRIDATYSGGAKEGYLAQYRGELTQESITAYDAMDEYFKPKDITPLFRRIDDQDAVILLDGRQMTKPSNPWINLLLFVITVISVLFADAMFRYQGPVPENSWDLIVNILSSLQIGIPFAASILVILLAHEFGHYLAARYHKTRVSLPYFIPFPLSPFGTMGAFIQMKEPPKNKRILLDIGIAGPIAGLVVAVPILLYGLYLSPVEQLPQIFPPGQIFEGNSILYLAMKYIVHGQLLPAPGSFGGLNPILYWTRYFFTGTPLPAGGVDVFLHPIAWAGWAGMLVTALNLIPAGQFDGGHIMYVLLGKNTQRLLPVILVLLVGLGFFWSGWWLWAGLIFLLGRRHAETLDQITDLDPKRKWLAVAGLVIFVLVFMPVPISGTF